MAVVVLISVRLASWWRFAASLLCFFVPVWFGVLPLLLLLVLFFFFFFILSAVSARLAVPPLDPRPPPNRSVRHQLPSALRLALGELAQLFPATSLGALRRRVVLLYAAIFRLRHVGVPAAAAATAWAAAHFAMNRQRELQPLCHGAVPRRHWLAAFFLLWPRSDQCWHRQLQVL